MQNEQTGLALLNEQKPTLAQLVLVNMPKGTTIDEATNIAIKEISNYEMILSTRPELKVCNPKSVVHAVKQCINDGLTLSQSAGLVYLLPTQVKVGQNGNQDIKEWALSYDPTANGRLSIAYQAGSILDHKKPTYAFDKDGKLDTVTFEYLVPSYKEPRWESYIADKRLFEKWMAASAAKNKGQANKNYTSYKGGIDPEFAATKAIRHGLAKLGANLNGKRTQISTALQDRIISETPVNVVINEAKEEQLIDEYIITQHGKVSVETAEILEETKGDLPV